MIPKQLFQTWYSKALPQCIAKERNAMIKANPQIKFYLYDDQDCEIFLKKFFPHRVLKAYQDLIPGSYKADLWRLCVLYIYGGFYMDIKFKLEKDVKLIDFCSSEIFTVERARFGNGLRDSFAFLNQKNLSDVIMRTAPSLSFWKKTKKIGVYNGFLATVPRNKYLKEAINKIVDNVEKRLYTDSMLGVTGPSLLGEVYFKHNYKEKLDQAKFFYPLCGNHIITKNKVIATEISGYRSKRKNSYFSLWYQRKIFKT